MALRLALALRVALRLALALREALRLALTGLGLIEGAGEAKNAGQDSTGAEGQAFMQCSVDSMTPRRPSVSWHAQSRIPSPSQSTLATVAPEYVHQLAGDRGQLEGLGLGLALRDGLALRRPLALLLALVALALVLALALARKGLGLSEELSDTTGEALREAAATSATLGLLMRKAPAAGLLDAIGELETLLDIVGERLALPLREFGRAQFALTLYDPVRLP